LQNRELLIRNDSILSVNLELNRVKKKRSDSSATAKKLSPRKR
jgi:hypothetical protein